MNAISVNAIGESRLFLEGLISMLAHQEELIIHSISHHDHIPNHFPHNDHRLIMIAITDFSKIPLKEIASIKKDHPLQKILLVFMSQFCDKQYAVLDLADACIFWDSPKAEFLKAIHEILNNRIYYSPTVMPLLLERIPNNEILKITQQLFSHREREVLVMVAEEKSNDQIAHELAISRSTVETHRKNMMYKAKVHSVVGLMKYGLSNQLITF